MKNEFHDRRNRGGGFKGRLLITLALVLSMIVSVPFLSNAAGEKFDSQKACSLTVHVNNADGKFEELKDAKLIYDLYKLADAVPNKAGDGYTFSNWVDEQLGKSYDALKNEDVVTSEHLHTLSQEAAGVILDVDSGYARKMVKPIKTKDGVKGSDSVTIEGLNAGLYLLVIRSDEYDKSEDDKVKYVKKATDEDGRENIVTRALTNSKSYVFLPQLISLPTKESEEGVDSVVVNAGDQRAWKYNHEIFLKPAMDTGKIRINKRLNSYYDNDGPVTFYFEVKAVIDGVTIYSNTIPFVFRGPGTESVVIENIPVGAVVTVTELYSGAQYTLTSRSDPENPEVVPDNQEPITFEFVNDFDWNRRRGHSIVNSFTYNDNGGWDLEQTQNGNQLPGDTQ